MNAAGRRPRRAPPGSSSSSPSPAPAASSTRSSGCGASRSSSAARRLPSRPSSPPSWEASPSAASGSGAWPTAIRCAPCASTAGSRSGSGFWRSPCRCCSGPPPPCTWGSSRRSRARRLSSSRCSSRSPPACSSCRRPSWAARCHCSRATPWPRPPRWRGAWEASTRPTRSGPRRAWGSRPTFCCPTSASRPRSAWPRPRTSPWAASRCASRGRPRRRPRTRRLPQRRRPRSSARRSLRAAGARSSGAPRHRASARWSSRSRGRARSP